MADESEKERGPKGGIKHQPGRGHDRKSATNKKKRFAKKAAKKREQEEKEAQQAWREWDSIPDDVKRLLGPTAQPKVPRPCDEQTGG
jgi:predicted RNA polymerase sigma factor